MPTILDAIGAAGALCEAAIAAAVAFWRKLRRFMKARYHFSRALDASLRLCSTLRTLREILKPGVQEKAFAQRPQSTAKKPNRAVLLRLASQHHPSRTSLRRMRGFRTHPGNYRQRGEVEQPADDQRLHQSKID